MRTISSDSVCILSLGVFLFCLMFPFISVAATDSQPTSLLNTAQEARESGDGEKAEGFYQQIIDNYPASREAITACQELAIRRIQLHEIENAESLIGALKTEYSASPDTVDALYSIARHYQWNGLPEKAINLHRYNSAAYPDSKKAMWSQGAIIHQYIDQKDFEEAQSEFEVLMKRFKDQPTLPQEVHQCAEKYRTTNEPERALALNQYNVAHSPTSSKFTMWSQGAIIHHYIRHGDFAAAKRETDVMIGRFSEQPTLPEQLHQIAEEYRYAEEADRSFELHQYNATHSPVSSKYTMQSQGALVHYLIEHKEFYPAEVEYQDLLSRFKDQPTLSQEIYQFAVKYNGVGEKEKALELHRYNVEHFPATSLHAMQSQGAIVHHCIETKDFEAAKREIDAMTGRFSEQESFPQELYQFALKYQGVGATEKAIELHRYNSARSPASSKYSLWSQGALIHYYINQKDYEAAQKGCEAMISRFTEQETLSHELHLIADKYQGAGQYALSRSLCEYGLATFGDIDSKLNFKGVTVKMLLAENKNAEAESVCSELLALCTNQSQMTRVLIHLGSAYHHAKHWNQAATYFQNAVEKANSPEEKLDAHAGLAKARIRMSSDFSEISSILDVVLTECEDCKGVGLRGVQIGEEYYYLGSEALKNTENDRAKEYLTQAVALWNSVLESNTDSQGECYYLTGMCFYEVGNYTESIKAFEQIHQLYPTFQYADYCLFMQGRCLEKLVEYGEVALTEATTTITTIYSQLVSEYPKSQYSELAKLRLSKYSF